jgi:hypothetical protein
MYEETNQMTPEQEQRAIMALGWLVPDAQNRFDECRNNLEEGSQGGYSPELTDAISLLDELKTGRDENA